MRTDREPSPPALLRARVLLLAAQQPAPSRLEVERRARRLAALGVVVPLLGFAGLGGLEAGARPWPLLAATVLGTGGLSTLAAVLAWGKGSRTLGRPRAVLLAAALIPAFLLLAWKVGVSATFAGMLEAWPTRPGLRCLVVSLLFGAVPLVTFMVARRRSDPVHPRSLGAALGASAGLWAATLVDLWCPVASPLHVLLGHVLPVLMLAGLGALAGWRVLALGTPDA